MDSKHRHELAENWLASHLADFIDRIRPHATLLAICLIGAALISAAWGFYRSTSRQSQAQGWESFAAAIFGSSPDMGALEEAAAEFKDSGPVAEWSSITYADGQLASASVQYLDDRDKAEATLRKAQDEYNRLLLQRGVQETIRQRAQYGLARSYELAGDVDKAAAEYEKVQGAFAHLASERAELLKKKGVQEDYAWLKVAQAPLGRAPGGPGVPGQQPAFAPDALETPAATPEDEQSLDEILSGMTEGADEGDDVDIGALLEEDSTGAYAPEDPPATEADVDPLMDLLEEDTGTIPTPEEAPSTENGAEGEEPASEDSSAEASDSSDASGEDEPASADDNR